MAKENKDLEEQISDGLPSEVDSSEGEGSEPKGVTPEEVVADTDTDEKGEAEEEGKSEGMGETSTEGKYRIGDEEYTADELLQLLEKGKLAKRVETEQRVDISQLYPEFTRRSQLLKNKDALREYYKESFRDELAKPDSNVSEEQRKVEAEIEAARRLGFITKKDLEEFKSEITQETTAAVEERELSKSVDKATVKHGVDRRELLEFMFALKLDDPDSAAARLSGYKGIAKPKIEVPKKPEVLNTEKRGSNLRVPKKERPIPNPVKDPEGYEARILEFLEHKTPEEL
jgi:hypothetical protein